MEEKLPHIISINFDKIEIGTCAIKKLKLKNNYNINSEYKIERDSSTNPLDQVFSVTFSKKLIKPNEYLDLVIKYKPKFTFKKDYDYFYVSINNEISFTLQLKGESFGPNLICYQTRKVFICQNPMEDNFEYLKFFNDSSVESMFHFNLDKSDNFKIEPEFGILKPFEEKIFKIYFKPSFIGIFIHNLVCSIKYQLPITILLIGIYKPHVNIEKIYLQDIRRYIQDNYFCSKKQQNNILSINPKYIDFGKLNLKTKCQTFIIENFSNVNFIIEWFPDKSNTFEVIPSKVKLNQNDSVEFQANFKTTQKDMVFQKIITGQAYWSIIKTNQNNLEIPLPIPLRINLLGNTFSEALSWAPEYLINFDEIIFPPAIPGCDTIISFIIYRKGHLPLMYNFIPPPKSHITINPKHGIILGPYQIFIATLNSIYKNLTLHHEEWNILFNDNVYHPINFRAYTDLPQVLISNNNIVTFPVTFVGTVSTLMVPLKNISRHKICYQYIFGKHKDILRIFDEKGIIEANQVLFQKWTFKPPEIGYYCFKIQCYIFPDNIRICQSKYSQSFYIVIQGESSSSELVAIPSRIDFGDSPIIKETEFNSDLIRKSQFNLYNFSLISITYKLWIIRRFGETNNPKSYKECNLKLNPSWGVIRSHENHKIEIHLYPIIPQLGNYSVVYQTCIDEKGQQLNTLHKPVPVVHINFNAIYPKFNFLDLSFVGNTPLFNKIDIWQMLNINKINSTLNSIESNTRKEIIVNVPESYLNEKSYKIFLLVKNCHNFKIKWTIKRIQICDCKLIAKDKSFSKRSWIYECPHRSLFTLTPIKGSLQGKESLIMQMEIKYNLIGSHNLKYLIELSNKREIELNILIKCFEPDLGKISLTYPKKLDMGLVAIDQIYWIYNNSDKKTKYLINCENLYELNNINFQEEIIKCLNPSGEILPFSNFPIIIQFNPLELKQYSGIIKIMINEEEMNLKIIGEGNFMSRDINPSLIQNIPQKSQIGEEYNKFILSQDFIKFDAIPIHSRKEFIFFIENTTTNFYFFQWNSVKIKDVSLIKMIPSKSILLPKELKLIKCIIKTLSLPTAFQVTIPCNILDIVKRKKHLISLENFKISEEKNKNEFTFTEKGYIPNENDFTIYQNPDFCYINFGLNICSVSDKHINDKFCIKNQLKLYPRFELEKKHHCKFEKENINMIFKILEVVIWEIVNERLFKHNIEKFNTLDKYYYAQFIFKDREKKILYEHFLNKPSNFFLERVLNHLMELNIREHFNLGEITENDQKEKHTEERPSYQEVDRFLDQVSFCEHE